MIKGSFLAFLGPANINVLNLVEIITIEEDIKLLRVRCSGSLLVGEDSFIAIKWAQGGSQPPWRWSQS